MTPSVVDLAPDEVGQLHDGGKLTIPGQWRPFTLTVSHVWPDQYRFSQCWVHGSDDQGGKHTLRVRVPSSD